MRLTCTSCQKPFEGKRDPEGLDLCRACGGHPRKFISGEKT